jgi:hypothetical protein
MSAIPSARPVATQARIAGRFPRNPGGTNSVCEMYVNCSFDKTVSCCG